MIAALTLPNILEKIADRRVMLAGAVALCAGLFAGISVKAYAPLLFLWFCLGVAGSLTQTPLGRLLKRSSQPEDRPALFAAQFALSHACWLITYPLAGWVGAKLRLPVTFTALAVVGVLAVVIAVSVWPSDDPVELEHLHNGLSPDHPHAIGGERVGSVYRHRHAFTIDTDHPEWPRSP